MKPIKLNPFTIPGNKAGIGLRNMKSTLVAISCGISISAAAQVGIGASSFIPNASAMLEVKSGTPTEPRGFLMPVFSDAQETNRTGADGMLYYSFAKKKFIYYNGASWLAANPWTPNTDGSRLLFDPGLAFRVGIGTSNPQSTLDLAGAITIGSDYAGVNAAPANGMLVQGNVAIGKTTATSQLDVNGTVTSTGLVVNSTGAAGMPVGTNAQRPASPSSGMIRFNSEINSLEYYNGTAWVSVLPPGTIVPFAGANVPAGWLLCNGQTVLRSNFPGLFSAIGTAWGTPSSTTFNLPDLQGKFLRGVDAIAGSGGFDPDDASRIAIKAGGNVGLAVGSYQPSATALPTVTAFGTNSTGGHSHLIANNGDANEALDNGDYRSLARVWAHGGSDAYRLQGNADGNTIGRTNTAGNHSHTFTGGDNETRPKNVYVNYIIKY